MTRRRSNLLLGLVMLAAFVAFFAWQTPSIWRAPLTPAEIDAYVAQIERNFVQDPDAKATFIARVRDWAAGDDGRPVLMVNLMRFRKQLATLPEGVHFQGTPQESNELYEEQVVPLALKRGEFPIAGGDVQALSLTATEYGQDDWDRIVVMRAPSRRAFIDFMADPVYGPAVPYKTAAAEVALIPVDADITVPDLRWLVGGLLLAGYFLILWRRAERELARSSRR